MFPSAKFRPSRKKHPSKTQVAKVREFEVRLIPRVLTRKFAEQLLDRRKIFVAVRVLAFVLETGPGSLALIS